MSSSNDISSNASDSSNLVKVKKSKVKENWDDESEEESEVELECSDIIASEEIIKDKEHYEKNELEYDDYEYESNFENGVNPEYGVEGAEPLEYEDYEYGVEGAEPLDDYDDYEEIDKKLGNHFRLH